MARKQTLSMQQAKVFQFVGDYAKAHGYPPTGREIAEHMGWSSASQAHSCLQVIEKKGWLILSEGARAIASPAIQVDFDKTWQPVSAS